MSNEFKLNKNSLVIGNFLPVTDENKRIIDTALCNSNATLLLLTPTPPGTENIVSNKDRIKIINKIYSYEMSVGKLLIDYLPDAEDDKTWANNALNLSLKYLGTKNPLLVYGNSYNQKIDESLFKCDKISLLRSKTINGSDIRNLIKNNEFYKLKQYVPQKTYLYFINKFTNKEKGDE